MKVQAGEHSAEQDRTIELPCLSWITGPGGAMFTRPLGPTVERWIDDDEIEIWDKKCSEW